MIKYSIDSKLNPQMIYAGIFLVILGVWSFHFSEDLISDSYILSILNTSHPNVSESRILKLEGMRNSFVLRDLMLYFIIFTIQILCTIWSVVVARKLHRSPLFWGVVTFFFTPISLIVLGTRDLKLEPNLSEVYNKYKSDYYQESSKIKRSFHKGRITEKECNKKLIDARFRYNELMNIEMSRTENMMDNRHNKEIINKVEGSGKPIPIQDKCPACGTKISEDNAVCPECGLVLR